MRGSSRYDSYELPTALYCAIHPSIATLPRQQIDHASYPSTHTYIVSTTYTIITDSAGYIRRWPLHLQGHHTLPGWCLPLLLPASMDSASCRYRNEWPFCLLIVLCPGCGQVLLYSSTSSMTTKQPALQADRGVISRELLTVYCWPLTVCTCSLLGAGCTCVVSHEFVIVLLHPGRRDVEGESTEPKFRNLFAVSLSLTGWRWRRMTPCMTNATRLLHIYIQLLYIPGTKYHYVRS